MWKHVHLPLTRLRVFQVAFIACAFDIENLQEADCRVCRLQVIRQYHGHLSGVYSLRVHQDLDLVLTGGRDSVCRVWDMRTKVQVHCLAGHDETVSAILANATMPQVGAAGKA